jgi:hypothetical protein
MYVLRQLLNELSAWFLLCQVNRVAMTLAAVNDEHLLFIGDQKHVMRDPFSFFFCKRPDSSEGQLQCHDAVRDTGFAWSSTDAWFSGEKCGSIHCSFD